MKITFSILLSCAIILCGAHAGSLMPQKGTILCRMTIVDTFYTTESGALTSSESPGCIPIVNNSESDLLLSIDLPTNITTLYKQELSLGELFIEVDGARRVKEDDKLEVTQGTRFNVRDDLLASHGKGRNLQAAGNITHHSVMVVRITSLDGVSPIHTLQEMRDRLFGGGPGLKSQYHACSFGQHVFADAGGIDITLPHGMSHYTTAAMVIQDSMKVVNDVYGKQVHELADNVMFCQPPGTGDWVAVAGTNHWRSTYNNEWCLSLTATMHGK
jgi:hypothetical protein